MPRTDGTRRRRQAGAAGVPGAPAVNGLRRERWMLAGILLLAAALYARTLTNGFIYFDDPDVVVNNPHIRALSGANLLHWLTTPVQYMYMPLALLSYAVDHRLGGLDPWVYHLHNLLLHLGCVGLAYWVFRRLDGRGRVALVVALLFAVHPVNVDTVASVAVRPNLLASLYSLLALGCYDLHLERRQARWLAVSWLAFVLAAAAKSAAVVLPLTFFLWDHARGRRWSLRLLVEKLPFLAAALLFGILALRMRVDTPPPVSYGAIDRALLFVHALASYCARLLVPWPLSLNYDFPAKHGPWLPLPYVLAPLLLALGGWGLRQAGVPGKVLVVGLGFFVLTLAPSQSALLIDGFLANRYAYLPYLGLFYVLADLFERAVRPEVPSAPPTAGRPLLRRRVAVAALVVAVAGLSTLTYRRTLVWRDSLTLFDDVIAKQPGSAWVWGTRGLVKLHTGDLAGARRDLDEALRLDPDYYPGRCYRGDVLFRLGEYPAALADLDRALALAPNLSGAYRDRGKVKLALRDDDGALADLERAIALDSRSAARFWRGMIRGGRGDYPGALADLDAAVENDPGDLEALYMRGMAKLSLGDHAAACADATAALRRGYQPREGQAVPDCP